MARKAEADTGPFEAIDQGQNLTAGHAERMAHPLGEQD
jgi:hypothetical protein